MPSQNTLNQIRARKTKKNGTIKKLKNPPKWLAPVSLEREYHKMLRNLVKIIQENIINFLVPEIPNMIAEVNGITPNQSRGDAWFDTLRGIILTIASAMQQPTESADIYATNLANRISDFNYNQFQKINKSVFGVDIFIDQPWLQDQLKLFASQNSQLITSISSQELERVSGIVERGLQEGSRFEIISEDIQKSFGISDRRAKLIARDQIAKLNASLTKLRQEELGVDSYRWQTSGDERVRPSHKANDGKIFRWDDPPKETGHPGTDINCRCVAIPILEGVI